MYQLFDFLNYLLFGFDFRKICSGHMNYRLKLLLICCTFTTDSTHFCDEKFYVKKKTMLINLLQLFVKSF